jgi:hypothetical protein
MAERRDYRFAVKEPLRVARVVAAELIACGLVLIRLQ